MIINVKKWLVTFFLIFGLIYSIGLLEKAYIRFYQAAYPIEYMDMVTSSSQIAQVEEAVILAVIRTESGFRPDVESSVGAKGLMQITPDTLDWVRLRMGYTDQLPEDVLYIPESNIYYGAETIALLMEEFGNLPTALAAYHAGWGNVTKWLKDSEYSSDGISLDHIPFADTSMYVEKVLATTQMYKRVYPHLN